MNKKTIRRTLLCAVLLFICYSVSTLFTFGKQTYKEGDIVFQMSKSRQSPLIQLATASPWSHCGIIIEKSDGLYVLEAAGHVKLTPLDAWIKRGRWGTVKRKRVFDRDIKIKYKKYLGQPYDLAFKFDNGKMYCSELIYVIYRDQFDTELCTPRPISDYHLVGMKRIMKRRGISPDQLAVAPSDLYDSDKYVR